MEKGEVEKILYNLRQEIHLLIQERYNFITYNIFLSHEIKSITKKVLQKVF